MRLGVFDVSVCIVELVVAKKELRQAVMDPKPDIVPVETGCDPEGCLVVVNCLLCLALVVIYDAKETVRSADLELIAFVRKEIDCLR